MIFTRVGIGHRTAFTAGAYALALAGCSDAGLESSTALRVFDDGFDDGDLVGWTAHNPHLARAYVGPNGLVLEPNAWTYWFNANQSVQYYQLATGDFAISANLTVTSLGGGVVQPAWRIAAIQIRNPNGPGVDAYHAGFGQIGPGQSSVPVFETKNTDNSQSQWWTTANASGSGQVRVCRVGATVRTMWRATPEDAWILGDERQRPDLPQTLAAGPVAFNGNAQANLRATFDDIQWHAIGSIAECATVGEDEGDEGSSDEGASTCVSSFDGTGDIAVLNDEFDDPGTMSCWTFRDEDEGTPAQYSAVDIDGANQGRFTLVPTTGGWFNDYVGPLVHKEITGDFIMEVNVAATSADDPALPPSRPFNSAGLMVRSPSSGPGNQDYLLFNVGAQFNALLQTEGKTTTNSVSVYAQTPGVNSGRLRICRVGSSFSLARRLQGEAAFTLTHTYERPDLPATLQAGMAATAWNGHAASPDFTVDPDLVATWDYVRFLPITDPAQCLAD